MKLINSFSFSGNQLIDIKTVYTNYFFCVFSNEQTYKDLGPKQTISGIQINIISYGNEVKTINKRFTLVK